jgi:hypothetical protein
MTRYPALRAVALAAASVTLSFAAMAQMTPNDARAGKDRIQADYKAARATCDSLAGNAKDICVAEAKGKEKVALAELEHGRTGKPADATKVAVARADAVYEVAKERCDDKAGNDKDVCVKDAKAAHTRAQADAKAARKSAEARSDAAGDKRDADYKAAVERCDALAGDAKTSCVNAAKAQFGKG